MIWSMKNWSGFIRSFFQNFERVDKEICRESCCLLKGRRRRRRSEIEKRRGKRKEEWVCGIWRKICLIFKGKKVKCVIKDVTYTVSSIISIIWKVVPFHTCFCYSFNSSIHFSFSSFYFNFLPITNNKIIFLVSGFGFHFNLIFKSYIETKFKT